MNTISKKYSFHAITLLLLIFSLSSCFGINKFSHGRFLKCSVKASALPIESVEGIITLRVKVNGVEGKFILDNGFTLCALDEEFAKKAHVTFPRTGSINDANNNNIELGEAKIDKISVGPFVLHNSFANQLNTQRFLPCDSIDGVLGASFINQINWKLDFENKIATLNRKEFNEEGTRLEMNVARNNISSTELEINNHRFNDVMIDFGYQGHIQVNKKHLNLFEGLNAELRGGIQSLSVSGLGNIDTSYTCTNVAIGSNGQPLINSSELVIKSNLTEDAIVGINYFENYTVYLNNHSKQIILQERLNYKFPLKQNFNASLYLVDGAIKIAQLNLNDPIAKEIQLMQTVAIIDGKSTSEFMDICYLKAYIKNKRCVNEPITIQLNGNSKEFILQSARVIKQEINSNN